ncbi:MAG: sugar phosphate isomerase/epimerase [Tepidisphaeraceae bacterium]|jgi:sugar phosphate isomerase/epimerase
MSETSISLQLYTLRDLLKTPAEIAATLKRVRHIGYQAVELAGLGPIEAAELAKILTGEGLTVSGGHVPFEAMKNEPQRVIDEHWLWDCAFLAVPGCWGKSQADFLGFIEEFNAIAPRYESAGFFVGYHNHSHELVRREGRTMLSLLVERLSPSIWFEIDTYWIAHGGGDPIQWIGNVTGRIPCVHLKDMSIDESGRQQMAEIGQGNLNFPGILAACHEAGTRWYVVEQDVCAGDPMESIAVSLAKLTEMGME